MTRFAEPALAEARIAEAGAASSLPLVSVIVPVYNDAGRLRACLHALENQTYPRSRYEIIVVDNGSDDGSAEIARRVPRVRVEREHVPGSYAARNRGIGVARGDVLAFTDADCIPAPEWIEEGVAHLRRLPRCGLVAGDIHIFPRDAARPTTVELYEALFDFDQQRFLERGRFGVTANLFTYASVVREIGAFDGSLRSAGDRDWGCRVAAAGYRQLYAPTATVRHAARRSWRALLNKRLRVMGGHRDLARKRGRRALGFAAALARQLVLRPLRASAAIRATRRSLPRAQKLKLLGLAVVLGWAEAFERIRLELGGQSLR